MGFDPGISIGTELTNTELCKIFACSTRGGMRRSLKTNTLVLVSDHIESIYDDRWDDNGILHYTGMGQTGDQSLQFHQNKTLNESPSNGVSIFLFEVFKEKHYRYSGEVQLYDAPYPSEQPDKNGNNRKVWIFPLQRVNSEKPILYKEELDRIYEKRNKKAKKLSDQELHQKLRFWPEKPGVRDTQSKQYVRNPIIAELTKRRANGHCDLCQQPAPFKDKNGEPYLENHHIEWLSNGGDDTLENTVALCPNCHRKMHLVNKIEDIHILKNINRHRHSST